MNIAAIKRMRWQILLVFLLLFPLTLWQSAAWTRKVAIDQIHEQGSDILNIYQTQIRSELEKFEFLPRILAMNEDIIRILSNPKDEKRITSVNRYLEEINRITQTSVVYVIDKTGLTIAASNWNKPLTFIGIKLDYRPYFQTAIEGNIGRYFGMGTTSQERGYYFAAPVERNGETLGVTVVKVGVSRLETPGQWGGNKVAITDSLGVIFVSSDPAWQFKTIQPLDTETLSKITESLQYSDITLSPLPVVAEKQVDNNARVLSIREDRSSPLKPVPEQASATRKYLLQRVVMPDLGWEIHVFSDLVPVRRAVVLALAVTVLSFITVFLIGLYLAQRRAAIREKLTAQEALQRAHDELETKVRKRTAELRLSNECLQREIEERKQAENELVQASKLAALGQLSAGIVHELNQPLAAIRSYAGNALVFLERQGYDQAKSNLITIGELIERIAKITAHLKTFARKTPGKVEPVSLRRAIAYALFLLETQLKRDAVEVMQDFSVEDIPVWGDSVRLEQVMVNLLKNALEAMHSQERPRKLYIQLAASAEQALLTIRDTGPGIPEAHLPQLFDAFFTTKEVGEGLGLGLSISNKIIHELGGSIRAGTHESGGAVFTITLLRADAVAREKNLA